MEQKNNNQVPNATFDATSRFNKVSGNPSRMLNSLCTAFKNNNDNSTKQQITNAILSVCIRVTYYYYHRRHDREIDIHGDNVLSYMLDNMSDMQVAINYITNNIDVIASGKLKQTAATVVSKVVNCGQMFASFDMIVRHGTNVFTSTMKKMYRSYTSFNDIHGRVINSHFRPLDNIREFKTLAQWPSTTNKRKRKLDNEASKEEEEVEELKRKLAMTTVALKKAKLEIAKLSKRLAKTNKCGCQMLNDFVEYSLQQR